MIPTRKVAAGGIAGAITTVIISICKDGFGYVMSPDLASAVTTIVGFVAAYLVPEKEA